MSIRNATEYFNENESELYNLAIARSLTQVDTFNDQAKPITLTEHPECEGFMIEGLDLPQETMQRLYELLQVWKYGMSIATPEDFAELEKRIKAHGAKQAGQNIAVALTTSDVVAVKDFSDLEQVPDQNYYIHPED